VPRQYLEHQGEPVVTVGPCAIGRDLHVTAYSTRGSPAYDMVKLRYSELLVLWIHSPWYAVTEFWAVSWIHLVSYLDFNLLVMADSSCSRMHSKEHLSPISPRTPGFVAHDTVTRALTRANHGSEEESTDMRGCVSAADICTSFAVSQQVAARRGERHTDVPDNVTDPSDSMTCTDVTDRLQ